MLEKSFWLYNSLKEGIAIITNINTGIIVHATSKVELWVVFDGLGLFLALNLMQTYKSKKKQIKLLL